MISRCDHTICLIEHGDHYEALRPAVESLKYKYGLNEKEQGKLPVIIGWHLLPEHILRELPNGTVIYNTEQVEHVPLPGYLYKHKIYDYSDNNNHDAEFLPLDLYPIERPKNVVKSDILFYGSVNDRRSNILAELRKRGAEVFNLFGVYGKELYEYISGAKVVLDMHYYSQANFNAFRVIPALELGAKVVSEKALGSYYQDKLSFTEANYEDLVEECLKLL